MSSAREVPTPAGIYDYLLGGDHHTEADREAAEKALAVAPETRLAVVENRAFMQRAVRYVAARGIRQYVDIGSGFPASGPVHQVAAEVIDDPHVVYVDSDPRVVALSREMIRSPHVAAIVGDLRDPQGILHDPETVRLFDWSEPVAVLMVSIVHFIGDDANPGAIIAKFREHMAPGSYLIVSHAAYAQDPDKADEVATAWDRTRSPVTMRTPRQIADFLTGFELIPPGLVTTTEWGTGKPGPTAPGVILAAVGRVP